MNGLMPWTTFEFISVSPVTKEGESWLSTFTTGHCLAVDTRSMTDSVTPVEDECLYGLTDETVPILMPSLATSDHISTNDTKPGTDSNSSETSICQSIPPQDEINR